MERLRGDINGREKGGGGRKEGEKKEGLLGKATRKTN